jgi:hypothetical protein
VGFGGTCVPGLACPFSAGARWEAAAVEALGACGGDTGPGTALDRVPELPVSFFGAFVPGALVHRGGCAALALGPYGSHSRAPQIFNSLRRSR